MVVVGVFAHDLKEAFDGFLGAVAGEAAADEVDFIEEVRREEEFFAAGAAFEDIDGGIDVGLTDFAVEDELHVAGAFELLEDEVVAFVIGFHEGGGHDGEGAGLAGVAGGGEEAAGDFEGAAVEAAGHGFAAAAAHGVVKAASEAGDGVEEHEDVLPGFDEAFGALDGELRHADVVAGILVVTAGHDFGSGQGAGDFRDFFRALIDEKDDDFDVFVIVEDGFGDVLEEGGFPRTRRGDDEAALTPPDGRDEVDEAGGVAFGFGFENVSLVRVDSG